MSWLRQISGSIRWKILTVFLAGLVLPTLGAAWISYREARNSLYRHSLAQQEKTLSEISSDLWALENQSRSQLSTMGTAPPTLRALCREGPVPQDLISTFLRMNPHWRDLILYDARGDPVWTSESSLKTLDRSELDPFFLETFGLSENQSPVFRKEGAFHTRFGLRVGRSREFAGIVSATLNLSFLEQKLERLRELSSIRAFLWDDRGTIFASNLTVSELREISEQVQPARLGRQILNSLAKVQHSEIRIAHEPVLFSATVVPEFISPRDPIPGQDWFLAVVSPTTQAFAELSAFQIRNLIFLSLLFAAASVVLWWMTRRISAPLEQMSSFAHEVSKGRREIRMETSERDEVGKLKTALNSMAEALGHYEKELVRQEVLASLGRMSSVMAHEIRNPLNAVKGAAQYLRLKFESDPQICEYCRIILEKVDGLSDFVNSLLKLARLPAPRLGSYEIQELFDAAAEPFRKQAINQAVELQLHSNGVQTVRCDRDQMIELMQNLTQNALHALTGGGIFQIQAREDGDFVEIHFSDDGPGIPAEIQLRLFVPFSTGKREGTGLGLVVCKMIAENHGGSLSYVGKGKGACFVLRIPR